MRMVFLAFLVLFLSVPAIADEPKTVIHDQKEAELLLGRHAFSTAALGLYCLDPECFGQAVIYKKDSLYYMAGGHVTFSQAKSAPYWEGGSILLRGIITDIHIKGFTFEGTIQTEYFLYGQWFPCTREGSFEFTRDLDAENRIDHKKEFWRLHAQETPEGCDIDADTSHVDLFVERFPY